MLKNKNLNLFAKRISWDEISPDYLQSIVSLAKTEDEGSTLVSSGNHTKEIDLLIPSHTKQKAALVAREQLVLSGTSLIPYLINAYDSTIELELKCPDSTLLEKGTCIAILEGNPDSILKLERPMLNFLQHLCGIASQTYRYSQALTKSHTRLLDTRKTTPGYRLLDKYAVACGGGWNHRLGLFDRIMIKDNHIASLRLKETDLTDYISSIRQKNPNLPIEVEIDNIEQLPYALKASPDIILLDNFSKEQIKKALAIINNNTYTEISGGVTLETLEELGSLGVDYISCGALTHQSTWKDIALDWI